MDVELHRELWMWNSTDTGLCATWESTGREAHQLRGAVGGKGAERVGNPAIFISFLEGTKTLNNTPLKLKKN